MNIKIVNDTGITKNTKIFDENGNDITKYFTELHVHFVLGMVVTADAVLNRLGIDVLASLNAPNSDEIESEAQDVKDN